MPYEIISSWAVQTQMWCPLLSSCSSQCVLDLKPGLSSKWLTLQLGQCHCLQILDLVLRTENCCPRHCLVILNYCFYNSGVELALQLKKMLVYVITSHTVSTDPLVDTSYSLLCNSQRWLAVVYYGVSFHLVLFCVQWFCLSNFKKLETMSCTVYWEIHKSFNTQTYK